MNEQLKINDPELLCTLLDRVHDRFYSISDLSYEADNKHFLLSTTVVDETPIRETRGLISSEFDLDVYPATLLFHNIESYSLDDQAEVGEGDINTIDYADGVITVRGSLPVTLSLRASELLIEYTAMPISCGTETLRSILGVQSIVRRHDDK